MTSPAETVPPMVCSPAKFCDLYQITFHNDHVRLTFGEEVFGAGSIPHTAIVLSLQNASDLAKDISTVFTQAISKTHGVAN